MARSRLWMPLAAVSVVAACAGGPVAPTSGAHVAISVAPLTLTGVTNAHYDVAVVNLDGATVWERSLSADGDGDGVGSVSYVGPCDADRSPNTVTLTVASLEDASGPLPEGSWIVPPPLSRSAPCVANADTAVDFDLTVARAASQGFFDVAVSFDDIFCSAKLDCGPTTAATDDLLLLSDATGTRRTTAVLGFACTAGPDGTADTHLYLDDLRVHCDGPNTTTVVSLAATGSVDFSAAGNANPSGYLFAAAVYQGSEALAHKVYWNVALGLDRDAFGSAGLCTLTTEGTASDGALAGNAIASGAVYPFVAWDVPLSDAAGRLCTQHAVDGTPTGVATAYSDGAARIYAYGVSWAGAASVPSSPSLFDHVGAAQDYVVSAGCTSLLVTAWGAGGGAGGELVGSRGNAAGGAGGFTRAAVPVTPGETLHVVVGGGGESGVEDGNAAGGYGGGASTSGSGGWAGGGAGGGLSGVFRGTVDQAGALVVAGGGGGGISANGLTGHGGAGGGDDGMDGGSESFYSQRGGGATPSAAGAAGSDGGSPGAALLGGAPHPSYIGGGGGGGYFGGGGGGWTGGHGGGGGGGSGYVAPGATDVTRAHGAGPVPPYADHALATSSTGRGGLTTGEAGGDGRVALQCNGVADALVSGSCPGNTVALAYGGGPVGLSVPAGCTTLAISAWASGGGSGGEPSYPDSSGAAGGFAAGTVAVSPGEMLLVWVGGGGSRGIEDGFSSGGFGGGGDATGSGGWAGGGAGGGLSGVFRGEPTQGAALVIAGAGGGGISANGSDAPGGAGGGAVGQDGFERAAGQGGGGGTQVSPGTAGADGGHIGHALGGGWSYYDTSVTPTQAWIAAGGGAGWFGGGGWTGGKGGGGGGGSGYVIATATGAVNVQASGTAPPHTGDPGYVAGVGVGGTANVSDTGQDGGDGLVILTWGP